MYVDRWVLYRAITLLDLRLRADGAPSIPIAVLGLRSIVPFKDRSRIGRTSSLLGY